MKIVGKQAINLGYAWASRPALKLASNKLSINSDWVVHIGFNSSIWLYSAAMRIGDKAEWSTLLDEDEDGHEYSGQRNQLRDTHHWQYGCVSEISSSRIDREASEILLQSQDDSA